MLRLQGIRALLCLVTYTSLVATAKSETPQTVTVLDKGEFHDSMTWHNGYLFVGRSRKNFNSHYTIEIYDNSLKLVRTLQLAHAPVNLAVYDDQSVIVTGINPELSTTQYSIVKIEQGQFLLSTYTLPETVWADRWLGNIGGAEYFADSGGNLADPAIQADVRLTAQTIFRTTEEGPRYLRVRISRPTVGIPYDDGMFVVQSRGIGSLRSDVLWITPEDPDFSMVLADYPSVIRDMKLSKAMNKLLVVDEERPRLIVINPDTKLKIGEVTLGQRPSTIQPLGRCALVGDFDTREIFVVDISEEVPTIINRIAIDLPTTSFKALSKFAVDPENGRIFARSNVSCNPLIQVCEDESNRVVAIEALAILQKCM